jgi:hypothetical protein
MSTWFRRWTAATFALAAGALVLAGPAAADPSAPPPSAPTEVDQRLLLLNDDGDAPVAPGGTVTFAMSATGIPEDVPQRLTVVLQLPDGLTFASADNENASGPCVPDPAGTTVTCTSDEPIAEGAWWVRAMVAADAPLGEFLTAKATLSTEIPDPDPANNVSSWPVFVTTGGDMSVAITAPPGPWPLGATFDARIVVHNSGPHRSPVRLSTAIVNSGLKITGWPASCQADPGVMDCPIDMIEAGADATINLRIRVAERGRGFLSLESEITPTAPDSDKSNNVATYRADITPADDDGDDEGGAGGGTPTLPITGAPAAGLALAGLSLLTAGAGALLLARRRG